jgi:hypothetical protein
MMMLSPTWDSNEISVKLQETDEATFAGEGTGSPWLLLGRLLAVVDALVSPTHVIFQPGDQIDGKQLSVVGMGGKLDIDGGEHGDGG